LVREPEPVRTVLSRRGIVALCVVGLFACDFDLDFDFDFDFDFDWPDNAWDWSIGCGTGTPGANQRAVFLFEQLPGKDHSGSRFAAGTTQRFALRTPEGEIPLGVVPDREASSSNLEILPAAGGLLPHGVRFDGPGLSALSLKDGNGPDWDRVLLDVVAPRTIMVQVGSAAMDRRDWMLPTEAATRVVLAPGGELRAFTTLRGEQGEALLGVYSPFSPGQGSVTAVSEGMVPSRWVGYTERASLLIGESGAQAEDATAILDLWGPRGATGTLQIDVVDAPVLIALEGHTAQGFLAFKPRDTVRLAAWGRTPSGSLAFGYPIRFVPSEPLRARVIPDPRHPDAAWITFLEPGPLEVRAICEADPQVSMSFFFEVIEPVSPN
jgi:hypothetical protein